MRARPLALVALALALADPTAAAVLPDRSPEQRHRRDVAKQLTRAALCTARAVVACERAGALSSQECDPTDPAASTVPDPGGRVVARFAAALARCDGRVDLLRKGPAADYEAFGCPGDLDPATTDDDPVGSLPALQARFAATARARLAGFASLIEPACLALVPGQTSPSADPRVLRCMATQAKQARTYAKRVLACQQACEGDYRGRDGGGGATDDPARCAPGAPASDPAFAACTARALARAQRRGVLPPAVVAAVDAGTTALVNDLFNQTDCGPFRWVPRTTLASPAQALATAGGRLFAATAAGIARSDDGGATWSPAAALGLPRGHVNALAALETTPPVLLAFVWGKGLHRSSDGGDTWTRTPVQPASPVISALFNPRAPIVPLDIASDASDPERVVLAAPGGFFRSDDGGQTWTALTISSPGKVNLVFTGAAVRGATIAAVSQNPSTLLPDALAALLEGGVFVSLDDGAHFENVTGNLPARAYSDVAVAADGTVHVATQDGGVFRHDGGGSWTALGGPEDALAVSFFRRGVSVASSSRGLWRLEAGTWTRAGDGAVAGLASGTGLLHDGTLHALEPGAGTAPPPPAAGTVHVALSFHTNLYHSFRGDSLDDAGFGKDITVIRQILDWLDDFPQVHGDWDIENAFSLDDILPTFAPDIVQRIAARRATGHDGLRIMSWNNGAVASQTREEFDASIDLAKTSYLATFGSFDPGVQPQENMFSPDHVGWYRALGIEWITLFNSATPFTGFAPDVTLAGAALYNPVTLADGADEITLVPAYHHADMLDHGGLEAWVRQIAATIPGDTLLLLHMDADSDFWVHFDRELTPLLDEPAVRFTTIQRYLDTHPPVARITLPGDLADGVGDGFASWAEKTFDHEIATDVARARADVDWARRLAGGDAAVAQLAGAALAPRLRTLSTTHFGLAAPFVHPDRVLTARARSAEALAAARAARDAAEALVPVAPGTVQLVNARDAAGTALVEIPLEVPAGVYAGPEPLAVRDAGMELPVAVDVLDAAGDPVRLRATAVLPMAAHETRTLEWRYDPAVPATATGGITTGALSGGPTLLTPFTECFGARATAASADGTAPGLDPRAVRVAANDAWTLPLCDGVGSVTHTRAAYDGLPGMVVAVTAQMPTPSNPLLAESVALSPLACTGDADTLTWRTFGGRTRTRPVRRGQETWNGVSADGWAAVGCAGGQTVQIAHRVVDRTTLAFLPLRNDDGRAVFAPLGTLWGDTQWHDARRIGGLGLGDIATAVVGSQFDPSAPDWAGATVAYRLLLGSGIDEGTLDLFAHPPLVRTGAWLAP